MIKENINVIVICWFPFCTAGTQKEVFKWAFKLLWTAIFVGQYLMANTAIWHTVCSSELVMTKSLPSLIPLWIKSVGNEYRWDYTHSDDFAGLLGTLKSVLKTEAAVKQNDFYYIYLWWHRLLQKPIKISQRVMPLFGSAEFQQHSESLLYLHKPILCGYLKSDFCLTLLEICSKVKCYFLLWKKQQFFMLFNIWTKMCFCFAFFGVYLLQSSLNLHTRPRLSKIEIVSSEIGKNRSKSTSVLIWLCSPGYDIFSSALSQLIER